MRITRALGRTLWLAAMLAAGACGGDAHTPTTTTTPPPPPTPPVEPPAPSQVIRTENARPGTGEWLATNRASPAQLAVWASPYSPRGGDTVDVFVHSATPTVRMRVFRIGWYGGTGGRLVMQRDTVATGLQPACSAAFPGPVVCLWNRTARFVVDPEWVSGTYLLMVTNASGASAMYPFVVRGGRAAEFLVVIPLFTWQAYNDFGGASLYTPAPAGQGTMNHRVSFERPYSLKGGGVYLYNNVYSNDLAVLRWLERNGYDVTYATDAELANGAPAEASQAKALLFAGHSEYWTYREYTGVRALRDAGKHLAFFAGNNAYWNVRATPGTVTGRAAHTITCFKTDADSGAVSPQETTTRFRDAPLNLPENGLYGVMYRTGTTNVHRPLRVPSPIAGAEATQFLAAAGLAPGDSVPDALAYEGDEAVSNGAGPANLQVIFRSPLDAALPAGSAYLTTFFVAPSGAGVFAGGNNEFARPLDGAFQQQESPALQKMMDEVLRWMRTH